MHRIKALFLASTLLAITTFSAQAEPSVVASLKPIHSLVAAVMHGVGEPALIVDGAGSPHTYALKPSQARMLESADIVFWVGHELEAFLEKPLETVGANAKSVELMDAYGLNKLKVREGGAFEEHNHGDDHGDEEHAEHDDHDDHEEAAEAGHHHHGEYDVHIWLDPENAKVMVHEIAETLVASDPDNAEKYEANAKATTARLDTLIADVSSGLAPVRGKDFIVFHDAYQYFENRFGMKAAGSITVSPEVIPGAKRVKEIQTKVKELGITCVFAEPQFEPKLVATITEGTQAKSGVIDPLGTSVENGPDLYFKVIRNIGESIKSCLSEAS